MRIGELSARTGASVRSIRYYEKQGLIASVRGDNGQRSFGEEAVERVGLIRRLLAAGLSSKTMADLLPCITDPSVRTPYLTQRLREERERILIQVEQLSHTVEALDTVIGDLAPTQTGLATPTNKRSQVRRSGDQSQTVHDRLGDRSWVRSVQVEPVGYTGRGRLHARRARPRSGPGRPPPSRRRTRREDTT